MYQVLGRCDELAREDYVGGGQGGREESVGGGKVENVGYRSGNRRVGGRGCGWWGGADDGLNQTHPRCRKYQVILGA